MYIGEDGITVVDRVDNSSIHQSLDSDSCQDHTNLPQPVKTLTREASDVLGERKSWSIVTPKTGDVTEVVDS